MANATTPTQHPNALLTVEGRRSMVGVPPTAAGPWKRRLSGFRPMPRRFASGGIGISLKATPGFGIGRRGSDTSEGKNDYRLDAEAE